VTRSLEHSRSFAGALAIVVGLTLAGPPAFAAGPASPATGPIAVAAVAKVAAVPTQVLAQATPAPGKPAPAPAAAPAEAGGKPFFKSTKGAITLVLIAGAIGYTSYSLGHDRVKSPAK
jgi:hypothetical protein